MRKKEAIRRMITLGLNHNVIEAFRNHDSIFGSADNLSYVMSAGSQTKMIEDAIAEIKRTDPDAVPYHAVIGTLHNGPDTYLMCNLLFVSGFIEDWAYERPKPYDENTFTAQCLAYNFTAPELSDIGICIFRKSAAGSLKRIR